MKVYRFFFVLTGLGGDHGALLVAADIARLLPALKK
jgi:hypothetical protein